MYTVIDRQDGCIVRVQRSFEAARRHAESLNQIDGDMRFQVGWQDRAMMPVRYPPRVVPLDLEMAMRNRIQDAMWMPFLKDGLD